MKSRRVQPPDHTRRGVSSRVQREIRRSIEQTAARYGVSYSWVIHEILADFFGIVIAPFTYRAPKGRNNR